jgi:uncharacterized membrane protein YpjA
MLWRRNVLNMRLMQNCYGYLFGYFWRNIGMRATVISIKFFFLIKIAAATMAQNINGKVFDTQ